jgi:hypothetical protein
MTLQATTLRPGFLVSLKTSITGNVSYRTTDLEPALRSIDGEIVTRWETEKMVRDAAEHERAIKERSLARQIIVKHCAQSSFGLLCPEEKAAELEQAIIDARRVADNFNATAQLSRITVNVIAGRVNPNDAEAVRSIKGELRELIDGMALGVRNLDAEGIRSAAKKAKSLGAMLSPAAQERVQDAIAAARSAATKITAAGEQAAVAVDHEAVAALLSARTSFLDLDGPSGTVEAPDVQARAIDLGEAPEVQAPTPEPLPFDMGYDYGADFEANRGE